MHFSADGDGGSIVSPSKSKQLKRLADALADGRATAEDAALLSQWLRDDPQAQEEYLDYIDLHAQLSWEFRGRDSEAIGSRYAQLSSAAKTIPSTPWPWKAVLPATFVAFAVTVLVVAMQLAPWGLPDGEKEPAAAFWQLTQAAGARWDSGQQLRVGDRRGVQRLQLAAGLVEVSLDNGVRAILSGPADLELVDSMNAWLHRGRVVFRVPPNAIGYKLETADANVIDLGTEFGVYSTESNGTEVQVYEGEVVTEVKSDASSPWSEAAKGPSHTQRLQGGQAVRIGRDAFTTPEELQFWPDRFVRYLPDPYDPAVLDERKQHRVLPYNQPQHQEIRIALAKSDVQIDGSLDDWDLSGQFTSRCEPPYDTFYHVQGAMMYDDQFLYIGANVSDPFPMRSTVSPYEDRELYGNGGCLAFRISTDRKMGWPVRGQGIGIESLRELVPEDYNEKLIFLVLWHYEPEWLPCLHIKYGMDQKKRQVNPPGYRGAFRKHEDGWGYTAEYAIPWSMLSAGDDPPRAGDTLGCTWLVHWAGPEGRNWKGQLIDVVNPAVTDWNFQNAGTWGRAVYGLPRD